jgi:hypothetical protein
MNPLPGQPTISPAAFSRCWQLTPAERRQLTAALKRDGHTARNGWPLETAARALDALRQQHS